MRLPLKRPDVRLYLGRGGSGKSYLARRHLPRRARVLIHDTNAESENAKRAEVCDTMADLARLVSFDGPIRICWRGIARYGPMDAFEWGNRAAWAGEGFTVLWEDADVYLAGALTPPWALRLMTAARHRDVSLFACARSAYGLPPRFRAVATRVIAFRTVLPADVAYLRGWIGDAADDLPRLALYEAIDWREGVVERRRSPFK